LLIITLISHLRGYSLMKDENYEALSCFVSRSMKASVLLKMSSINSVRAVLESMAATAKCNNENL
jgi:hypothetical protein